MGELTMSCRLVSLTIRSMASMRAACFLVASTTF